MDDRERTVLKLREIMASCQNHGLVQNHPNYPAWRDALLEIADQVGVSRELFEKGFSHKYSRILMVHGADPKQLIAIATLLFK